MHNLIDLSTFLTPEAFKQFNKGQTLGFKQEDGTIQRYKIIQLNKRRRTGFAEKVTLLTPEEMGDKWEELRNG